MLTVITVAVISKLPTRNVAENFLMSSTQEIRVSTRQTPIKYGHESVSLPVYVSIVVRSEVIMNEMCETVKLYWARLMHKSIITRHTGPSTSLVSSEYDVIEA